MQRSIAKLLLLLFVLTGMFMPVVEAFALPAPHACCLRRLHELQSTSLQISGPAMRGNCCPPMTAPHQAQTRSAEKSLFVSIAKAASSPVAFFPASRSSNNTPSRAPPLVS